MFFQIASQLLFLYESLCILTFEKCVVRYLFMNNWIIISFSYQCENVFSTICYCDNGNNGQIMAFTKMVSTNIPDPYHFIMALICSLSSFMLCLGQLFIARLGGQQAHFVWFIPRSNDISIQRGVIHFSPISCLFCTWSKQLRQHYQWYIDCLVPLRI